MKLAKSKVKVSTSVSPKSKTIEKVIKRTGEVSDFKLEKIATAAYKAMLSANEGSVEAAKFISERVQKELLRLMAKGDVVYPHVEQIQDMVERSLMLNDFLGSAKAFILYRKKRAELRDSIRMNQLEASESFSRLVKESSKYFRSSLSEFVYYTSYSRWLEDKGRRETWLETVQRFMDFMRENVKTKFSDKDYKDVHEAILNQSVIPSMRLFWSSGDAARATNVCAYNCAYIAISDLKDFSEIMYISMCGTGVGFSVEKKTIDNLPIILEQDPKKKKLTHVIQDSKEGWGDALYMGLKTWYAGGDIEFDYSLLRPKGSRLKTMGGRASGPAPLKNLLEFAKSKILAAAGRRLTSLEVHDIACKVGEIVIAGGVRRSAMISLSDLKDQDIRTCKTGQFWVNDSQRSMANNSAVYETKPNSLDFIKEWNSLIESNAGERGIFNRGGLLKQLPERRLKTFKPYLESAGSNPCGEIVLRSKQFCNLTAIVVRDTDTEKTLLEKIRIATILGTYQASLTNFKYLSPDWKKNCEEEALLGVSFTGYYDNKVIRSASVLAKLKTTAIAVNKDYAKKLGINQSTCVTCVKPSGNSSQLLDTGSGLHPRFAKQYIRRVRVSSTDPIFTMLKDQGVSWYPEVGQDNDSANTFVLEFPVRASKNAITKDDISAVDLLEEWKKIKLNFTEHNPSATIYVGSSEWVDVAKWVYDNWDFIGGLTFLPRSDHKYQLAPYEECDNATYEALLDRVKNVDFSKLVYYEFTDATQGAKEYACVGGACEL